MTTDKRRVTVAAVEQVNESKAQIITVKWVGARSEEPAGQNRGQAAGFGAGLGAEAEPEPEAEREPEPE